MATSRQRAVLASFDASFSVGQRMASTILSRLPVGFSASDALFVTAVGGEARGKTSEERAPEWLAEALLATTVLLNDIPVFVANAESDESLRLARDQLIKARHRQGKSGFSLIVFIAAMSGSSEEAAERLSRVVAEYLSEGGVAVAAFSHLGGSSAGQVASAASKSPLATQALISQVMTRISELVPSCRLIRPSTMMETLLPYSAGIILVLTR